MALTEYKSTSKYGHNKMHYRAQPNVPRLSIGEKLYERRFIEGKKLLDEALLELKINALAAKSSKGNTYISA
jgi:hypothetical protein